MSTAEAQRFLESETLFAEVDGVRVAYRRFGSGPPMVLLHGWPVSGFTFRRLLPLLEPHFDCIVPDLPGAGDTPWEGVQDFSIEARSRLAARFGEVLGLDRYFLLAHDTGATLARYVAWWHPERIRALVVMNTEAPHHRPAWIPLYQRTMALPGGEAGFRASLMSRIFTRSRMSFGGCFCDVELVEGDFREHTIDPLVKSSRALHGQVLILRGINWEAVDRLEEIHPQLRVPTLVVWGTDDPYFPMEEGRKVAAQIPGARLVEIPGTRLLLHEEKPGEIARAVLDFTEGMRTTP
ncbi:MAG TPA: alpha/beta hydrolase [Longimicrobium sp.]|nr:alpha/beta hydrolase [Longimicrobium sp.]